MSMTFTQHVNPVVEQWLGKPILVAEAGTCDLCGRISADVQWEAGWSYSLGETVDASVCVACRGEGDD